MFDQDFYSPSLVIAQEQALLVYQLQLVRVAVALFQETAETIPEHARGRERRYIDLGPENLWAPRLDLAGKAFVYETTTLRSLAIDVTRRFPQFATDAAIGIAKFDAFFPKLVDLRDSQAHIDERLNARARGRSIDTRNLEFDEHKFGLITPPHASGNTVQGTTAKGEHAVIRVDDDASAAATDLVATVFASILLGKRRRHAGRPQEGEDGE